MKGTVNMLLPITLVAAGGAALINFWLATRIGSVRRAEKISVGDGGNMRLIARMRAQANFIEYGPLTVILIGLVELAQGPSVWLWAAMALFLIGRVLHAIGMDGNVLRQGRSIGTALTFLVMLGLGVYALVLARSGTVAAPGPILTSVPAPRA